jgi:hypothetical protein
MVLDTGTFGGDRVTLFADRNVHEPLIGVEGSPGSEIRGASGIGSTPPREDESVTMSLGPQGGVVWGSVSDRLVRAELRTVEGATFPATLLRLPEALGVTGVQAVWGFVDGPTADRVTTLLYDGEGRILNHSYPTGPREVIATGEDPAAGPWRLFLDTLNIGTGLGFESRERGGGSCCLKPLGDQDLVLDSIGSSPGKATDVLALASIRVSRVALVTNDGALIEGHLFPIPERIIGPAQVVLVLVPPNVSVNGDLIAFDIQGEELARRAIMRDRYS